MWRTLQPPNVVVTLVRNDLRDRATRGRTWSVWPLQNTMKTSSCKAKGRKLQKDVAKSLFDTFVKLRPDLQPDDIKSTAMGQSGVDVLFSPLAKKYIPLAIECKAVEKLNVVNIFEDHHNKYSEGTEEPILVHRRNRSQPLVTLRWDTFLRIFSKAAVA